MAKAHTGAHGKLLDPGLRKVRFDAYEHRKSEWERVFNTNRSKRNYERDYRMAGLGETLAKPEGEPTQYDVPIAGGTLDYTWTSYGLGFRVTREMYDDDLYGPMRRMARELGVSNRITEEKTVWKLLNNAFVTTDKTGFDGLALCSTAHTRLDGGATIANRPSTDVDLSLNGLMTAVRAFEDLVNERGYPIKVMPKYVVYDPYNMFAARELLSPKANYRPYDATNTINALQEEELVGILSHWLTSDRAWFVLAEKGNHDLNFWWRTSWEFDSGDDFDSGDSKHKTFGRFGYGFAEWRGVWGTSGGS